MPRNFRRRVEIMFPIEDPRLRSRIVDGILGVVLTDNVKARVLQPDGTYRRIARPSPASPSIRSQVEFQNMAQGSRRGRAHAPAPAIDLDRQLNARDWPPFAQYESALTTSPPAIEPRATQVGRLTEFLKNRTEPSASRELTPPGWRLRDAPKLPPSLPCEKQGRL